MPVQESIEVIGLGDLFSVFSILIASVVATVTLIYRWWRARLGAEEALAYHPIHFSGDVEVDWSQSEKPTKVPEQAKWTTCLEAASTRFRAAKELRQLLLESKPHLLTCSGFNLAGFALLTMLVSIPLFLGFGAWSIGRGIGSLGYVIFYAVIGMTAMIVGFVVAAFLTYWGMVRRAETVYSQLSIRYGRCECQEVDNGLQVVRNIE